MSVCVVCTNIFETCISFIWCKYIRTLQCFLYVLTENRGNTTLATNRIIVPPCTKSGSDFGWGKYDYGSSTLSKLEGCCNVFRAIFDRPNIQQIMSIMKHTIGVPLPFGKFKEEGVVDGDIDRLVIPNQGEL